MGLAVSMLNVSVQLNRGKIDRAEHYQRQTSRCDDAEFGQKAKVSPVVPSVWHRHQETVWLAQCGRSMNRELPPHGLGVEPCSRHHEAHSGERAARTRSSHSRSRHPARAVIESRCTAGRFARCLIHPVIGALRPFGYRQLQGCGTAWAPGWPTMTMTSSAPTKRFLGFRSNIAASFGRL